MPVAHERTADVLSAHQGARGALFALALNLAVTVASLVECCLRARWIIRVAHGDALSMIAAVGDDVRWDALALFVPGVWAIGCVAVVMWLQRTSHAAVAMKAPGPHETPFSVVAAFVVPGINLVRPYRLVRRLHDALDPGTLPDAPPHPRTDGAGHYRATGVAHADVRVSVPRARVGAWWSAWLLGNALGVVALLCFRGQTATAILRETTAVALGDLLVAVSLVLAIGMIRRVDARLEAYDRALMG